MTDGLGRVTFWGFTPALDITDAHDNVETKLKQKGVKVYDNEEELHILLVGAGDLRHILKTVAQSWRHRDRKLHFYIVENSLELYVRDMLLLSLLMEPPHRMGIREKMELYLEIHSNLLVRQQTVDYIKYMADQIIKMVTNFDHLESVLPCLDLSRLKYKEIDMMEGVAKFWRKAERDAFDAHHHWDQRLRQYLGTRYDAIPNVFDWDYSMKLCDRDESEFSLIMNPLSPYVLLDGTRLFFCAKAVHNHMAEIINGRVYSTWRRSGVAYEIRDGTYNQPNYTLATGLVFKQAGERVAKRGYWGDILVSPYISHGIESENTDFYKKKNNVLTNTSIDVAEYNVTALLHELTNHKEYKPVQDTGGDAQRQTATLTEITEEEEEEEEEVIDVAQHQVEPEDPLKRPYSAMPLENVKITFLSLNSTTDLPHKDRYHNLFNVVYFSNSMVHLLNKDLCCTFKQHAHLILETAKYMLELKPEQTTEFGKKVTGIASTAGFKSIGEFDGAKDSFIHMVYQPS